MRPARDLTKPQPLTAREWVVGLFWFVLCGAVTIWLLASLILFAVGAI
jgi:hypothetical protein